MYDLVKRALFTGLGLASLTREKLEELGQDISRHAKLTEEQTAELQTDLEKRASQARTELENEIDRRVEAVLTKLRLVRSDEYESLQLRVNELERRMRELHPSSDV